MLTTLQAHQVLARFNDTQQGWGWHLSSQSSSLGSYVLTMSETDFSVANCKTELYHQSRCLGPPCSGHHAP